jgi:hypothetical protein
MSPPTDSGRMARKRSFRAHFLDRRTSTQTQQTEPFLETKVCITRLFGTEKNQEIRLPTLGLASTECQKMPLSILEHRLMQCSFTSSPGKERRASPNRVFASQNAGHVDPAKCAS